MVTNTYRDNLHDMPTIKLLKRRDNRVITVQKARAQKIYQDKRWKLLRAEKMRLNPLCEECENHGRVTPTAEVHHIITIDDRPDLAFEWDNLMSVCVKCHKELDK
jgi:5-methylcytosine-specific restriction protein A